MKKILKILLYAAFAFIFLVVLVGILEKDKVDEVLKAEAEEVTANSDWVKNNLHGEVRETTTVEYKGILKDDEVVKDEKEKTSSEKYNLYGYITQRDIQDGATRTTREISYLSSNKSKIKRELDYWNTNATMEYVYEYDDKGLLKSVKTTPYNKKDFFESVNYEYDEMGNKIKEVHHSKDKEVYYSYTYQYDKEGNNTGKQALDPDGKLETRYEYKYENGKLVEEKEFDADEKLHTTKEYKYDDKGNVSQEKEISGEDGSASVKDFEYVYDDKSNWIKKTSINRNENTVRIWEREIKY
ncbi:MAG: hypothetical protein J5I50_13230 [Chitinophagaceae bacterium]|nr:hypothetical protein [Chitinophagaceae bacterium]